MDSLPLEILQAVFTLACTDGGRTGCSLALTSVSVRAAARIARFHSVSLVAYPSRLESFVALYAREASPALGDRPRIAHLHLTIPPDSLGLGADPPAPAAHTSLTWPKASARPEPEPIPVEYTANYKAAARTLTRLVAADLESLALQYGFRHADVAAGSWLDFIDRPLPRLRSLAVLGLLDLAPLLPPELSSPPQGQGQAPLFPALTHLHAVRRDPELLRTGHLAFWRTHAPRATHVRVALLPAHHPHTLRALADAVGVPWVSHPYPHPHPRPHAAPRPTYPSVRRLVLQRADAPAPAPAPAAASAGNVEFAQGTAASSASHAQTWCEDAAPGDAPELALDEGLRRFRDAASRARTESLEVCVAEPCHGLDYHGWGVRIRDEWLARVRGEAGGWGW
ncbi:hypothetical protein C8Q79DRAFT_1011542 [Trametes meyenii]|nr:hypothetical protein C8Q79DRAFT_1011542 [Trametes meyenii]